MKRFVIILISIVYSLLYIPLPKNLTYASSKNNLPKLAIVIDDFGSFDQSGVDAILSAECTLTCAVIPFVDNTKENIEKIKKYNHEVILHMPMQSHVNLPESWYGPTYITTSDNKSTIEKKLTSCINEIGDIKGFNIHIGSGVSRNKKLMSYIYEFAKNHNLYFLDSRTIVTHATENACSETNSIYLGRDVFLEADKNKTYNGVKFRLNEAVQIAKDKGYAIAIGHVGAEGGENTARAIIEFAQEIKNQNVEIVSLYEIYQDLLNNKN